MTFPIAGTTVSVERTIGTGDRDRWPLSQLFLTGVEAQPDDLVAFNAWWGWQEIFKRISIDGLYTGVFIIGPRAEDSIRPYERTRVTYEQYRSMTRIIDEYLRLMDISEGDTLWDEGTNELHVVRKVQRISHYPAGLAFGSEFGDDLTMMWISDNPDTNVSTSARYIPSTQQPTWLADRDTGYAHLAWFERKFRGRIDDYGERISKLTMPGRTDSDGLTQPAVSWFKANPQKQLGLLTINEIEIVPPNIRVFPAGQLPTEIRDAFESQGVGNDVSRMRIIGNMRMKNRPGISTEQDLNAHYRIADRDGWRISEWKHSRGETVDASFIVPLSEVVKPGPLDRSRFTDFYTNE